MIFYVNNQEHPWVDSVSLAQTLTDLNLSTQRGIAIAVNNAVIPKADWPSYTIHPDDRVTIIRATQGG